MPLRFRINLEYDPGLGPNSQYIWRQVEMDNFIEELKKALALNNEEDQLNLNCIADLLLSMERKDEIQSTVEQIFYFTKLECSQIISLLIEKSFAYNDCSFLGEKKNFLYTFLSYESRLDPFNTSTIGLRIGPSLCAFIGHVDKMLKKENYKSQTFNPTEKDLDIFEEILEEITNQILLIKFFNNIVRNSRYIAKYSQKEHLADYLTTYLHKVVIEPAITDALSRSDNYELVDIRHIKIVMEFCMHLGETIFQKPLGKLFGKCLSDYGDNSKPITWQDNWQMRSSNVMQNFTTNVLDLVEKLRTTKTAVTDFHSKGCSHINVSDQKINDLLSSMNAGLFETNQTKLDNLKESRKKAMDTDSTSSIKEFILNINEEISDLEQTIAFNSLITSIYAGEKEARTSLKKLKATVNEHKLRRFLNTPNDEGETPFGAAVECGQEKIAKDILDIVICPIDSKGESALNMCIRKGLYKLFLALTKKNPLLTSIDTDNTNLIPMMVAIMYNRRKFIGWLLHDKHSEPKNGHRFETEIGNESIFHTAVKAHVNKKTLRKMMKPKHTPENILAKLITKRCEKTQKGGKENITPIIAALRRGRIEAAISLIYCFIGKKSKNPLKKDKKPIIEVSARNEDDLIANLCKEIRNILTPVTDASKNIVVNREFKEGKFLEYYEKQLLPYIRYLDLYAIEDESDEEKLTLVKGLSYIIEKMDAHLGANTANHPRYLAFRNALPTVAEIIDDTIESLNYLCGVEEDEYLESSIFEKSPTPPPPEEAYPPQCGWKKSVPTGHYDYPDTTFANSEQNAGTTLEMENDDKYLARFSR